MNTRYVLRANQPISCGRVSRRSYQFRDASLSWESFDIGTLPEHFAQSLGTFRERIDALEDPKNRVSATDKQELFFMLEEVLYVRSLLTDQETIQ